MKRTWMNSLRIKMKNRGIEIENWVKWKVTIGWDFTKIIKRDLGKKIENWRKAKIKRRG